MGMLLLCQGTLEALQRAAWTAAIHQTETFAASPNSPLALPAPGALSGAEGGAEGADGLPACLSFLPGGPAAAS